MAEENQEKFESEILTLDKFKEYVINSDLLENNKQIILTAINNFEQINQTSKFIK